MAAAGATGVKPSAGGSTSEAGESVLTSSTAASKTRTVNPAILQRQPWHIRSSSDCGDTSFVWQHLIDEGVCQFIWPVPPAEFSIQTGCCLVKIGAAARPLAVSRLPASLVLLQRS